MNVVFDGDEVFLKPVQRFGDVTVNFEKGKDGKFVAKDVPERIARNMAMNPLYVIDSEKPLEAREFKVEPNPEPVKREVKPLPFREKKKPTTLQGK